MERQGEPYSHFADRGVWIHSLGPQSRIPGPRLMLAIYDAEGNCLRKLEQIRGACLDKGYVDFFGGPNCRPARYDMPVVDIDPESNQQNVMAHNLAPRALRPLVDRWSAEHGTQS